MSTTHNFFKTLVLTLAAMVLVYLGVGQVLANQWRVETTQSLAASEAQIASMVTDLSTWSRWSSTDANLGPDTVRTVAGTRGTVGHRIEWSGPMGKAFLTLSAVEERAIEYTFSLQAKDATDEANRGSGRVEWRADGTRCQVRWIDQGTWATLPERWYGWFGALQDRVQQFQVTSLQGLQASCEGSGGQAGK